VTTFASISVLLVLVSLLACYLPATSDADRSLERVEIRIESVLFPSRSVLRCGPDGDAGTDGRLGSDRRSEARLDDCRSTCDGSSAQRHRHSLDHWRRSVAARLTRVSVFSRSLHASRFCMPSSFDSQKTFSSRRGFNSRLMFCSSAGSFGIPTRSSRLTLRSTSSSSPYPVFFLEPREAVVTSVGCAVAFTACALQITGLAGQSDPSRFVGRFAVADDSMGWTV
jgi:hypothetical protein